MAATMNTDWSLMIAVETPGGRVAARPASRALTSSATVTVFCPDCF